MKMPSARMRTRPVTAIKLSSERAGCHITEIGAFGLNSPTSYRTGRRISTGSRGEFKKRGFLAGDEIHVGVDDVGKYQPGKFQTVIFPQMLGRYGGLGQPTQREYLLHTDEARARARDLYSLGAKFLYGMLFRASFEIRKQVVKEIRTVSRADFSVGLHSRHYKNNDDGCHTKNEKRCLERSLAKQSVNETCRVMI